jgi:hypothetical protein
MPGEETSHSGSEAFTVITKFANKLVTKARNDPAFKAKHHRPQSSLEPRPHPTPQLRKKSEGMVCADGVSKKVRNRVEFGLAERPVEPAEPNRHIV